MAASREKPRPGWISRAVARAVAAAALLAAALAAGGKAMADSDGQPPVLVVTDMGSRGDDAAALLMLLRGGARVRAVLPTAGNVWTEAVAANVRGLLAAAGRADIPIAPGLPDAAHEARRAFHRSAEGRRRVAGAYAGALAHDSPGAGPAEAGAVEAILRAAAEAPGDIVLLLFGPGGALAAALERDPGLAERIGAVYAMGGALDVPGNATARAEFNFWFDPEAADALLSAGLPLTLVPLDATAGLTYPAGLARRIDPAAPLAAAFRRNLEARARARSGAPVALWDEVLAAVFLDPSVVVAEETVALAVSTARDESYGVLLRAGAGRPPVRVIRRVDGAKVRALLDALFAR